MKLKSNTSNKCDNILKNTQIKLKITSRRKEKPWPNVKKANIFKIIKGVMTKSIKDS